MIHQFTVFTHLMVHSWSCGEIHTRLLNIISLDASACHEMSWSYYDSNILDFNEKC